MIIGFFIIIIIVIFGGCLSFLGNRVGMKVGKSRFSVFGLRPRHTSMLITIVTGFLISGLTLFVVILLSDTARTALFELQTIQRQMEESSNKVKQLTSDIAEKEQAYGRLSLEHAAIQQELNQKINEYNEKVVEYNAKVSEYNAVSGELLTKQEELQVQQGRVENLSQVNDGLASEIVSKEQALSRYEKQISGLEENLMQLSAANRLGQTVMNKPLLFWVGEILASKVIPADKGSADKLFDTFLEPLLLEANNLAIKRGAKIEGKSNYAVRIDSRRTSEVLQQLSKLKVAALVRVVVKQNSVSGEAVAVDLEVYENKLVFKDGATIAETKIMGTATEANLRDEILALLVVANHRAVESGIDTSDLNNFITLSEMLRVMNFIKIRPNGVFYIRVLADGDTYRIGDFKVRLAAIEALE